MPGAHLYKTGDVARYLADGNIEFLGRFDHQVKVRGFRIEPGEIESALLDHPAVDSCLVLAHGHSPGETRLVAYLVGNREKTPSDNDLRDFLKKKLPAYMIPAAFIMLTSLPFTPNGKVDRRALPAPDWASPKPEQIFAAPQTDLEKNLAKIWSEILSVERIGIHDDFFELGGHSISAIRVNTRIFSRLHVDLPLSALFEFPTINELAGAIIERTA